MRSLAAVRSAIANEFPLNELLMAAFLLLSGPLGKVAWLTLLAAEILIGEGLDTVWLLSRVGMLRFGLSIFIANRMDWRPERSMGNVDV